MKKLTTIAIAGIFSVAALIGSAANETPTILGQKMDTASNTEVNFGQELGELDETDLRAAVDFDQELGARNDSERA